jgi:hypothetical protein
MDTLFTHVIEDAELEKFLGIRVACCVSYQICNSGEVNLYRYIIDGVLTGYTDSSCTINNKGRSTSFARILLCSIFAIDENPSFLVQRRVDILYKKDLECDIHPYDTYTGHIMFVMDDEIALALTRNETMSNTILSKCTISRESILKVDYL